MENTENASTAVVTEEGAQETQEIAAEELFENLTREDEPELEETQSETQEPEQEENELSPEEAHKQSVISGLQTLFEDGWTQEELLALSNDATVRADIAAGKDVIRAAMAYERRNKAAAKPAAKKSVPTLRQSATSGARNSNRIEEMTDAEFDEFSRKAKEAMRAGKLVKFE